MSLIGDSPTVGSVSTLVRTASESEIDGILDEVLQKTDGPILVNLAANGSTRPKLVKYLTDERLKEHFDDIKKSDPQFVALSWIADEDESRRDAIVSLITTCPIVKPALTVLSRLLSTGKLDVSKLDDKVIRELLPWLQTEGNDKDHKHWMMLATVIAKSAAPSHQKVIESFVNENLGDENTQGVAYASIRTLYDEVPSIVEPVWNLHSPELTSEFTSMLSAICNNKTHREKVEKSFGQQVFDASFKGDLGAAVVEAKIRAGITDKSGDLEEAAKRLDELSSKLFEKNVDASTLEGFACTSMLRSVRNRIAAQPLGSESIVSRLVDILKSDPGSYGYAVLAILVQLAKFPMKLTHEEQHKYDLRVKSLGKTLYDRELEASIENEDTKFHARQQSGKICDHIIASSLVSWMVSNAPKLSIAAHEQVAYLLRELTAHQERHRREKLGSQGAAVVAIYLWALDQPRKLDAKTRSVAASALARILSSVVPQVALTGKLTNTVVVTPLCDQIHNENSERPNLDTFEALRALTNLASSEDHRLRLAISNKVWPKMSDALNSEYLQIRRSSLELICNLMTVASSAAHFLRRTPESKAMLSVLGQSLLVEDEDSRLASAGALAILSEWESAPECIGHNDECVEGLSRALGLYPDDDAMLLRVLACLNTVIKVTSAELDDEVVERIVFNEGLTHLEGLVDTLDPEQHGEVAKLVLQCVRLIAEYKIKNPA